MVDAEGKGVMNGEQRIEAAFADFERATHDKDAVGTVKAGLLLRQLAMEGWFANWRAFVAGVKWMRAKLGLNEDATHSGDMLEAADERWPFEDSVRVKDLEHQLEAMRRARTENLIQYARVVNERGNVEVERDTLRSIVEEALGGLTTIAVIDGYWRVVDHDDAGKSELLLGALMRHLGHKVEGGDDVGRTDQGEDAGRSGADREGDGSGGEHVSGGDEAGAGEGGHVEAADAGGTQGASDAVCGGAVHAEDETGASREGAEAAAVRVAASEHEGDGATEAAGERARGEGGEACSENEPGKWGRYVGGELIAPPGTFGFKVEE